MIVCRTQISDEIWLRVQPHVEKLVRSDARSNLRKFIEAVFWIARTGAPWRDLQPCFGRWNTVYRRFRRWTLSRKWERLHRRIVDTMPQVAALLLDSTAIRAHSHAAGAHSGQQNEGLGRSRGGLGTKIHAAVSERGRLVAVTLTGAQQSDIGQAEPLLCAANAPRDIAVVADKAYDCDRFVRQIASCGHRAVIPSKKNRRQPRPLDKECYRTRNVVERFFGRIKQYRRIATRYEKTSLSFLGFVFFVVVVALPAGFP